MLFYMTQVCNKLNNRLLTNKIYSFWVNKTVIHWCYRATVASGVKITNFNLTATSLRVCVKMYLGDSRKNYFESCSYNMN